MRTLCYAALSRHFESRDCKTGDWVRLPSKGLKLGHKMTVDRKWLESACTCQQTSIFCHVRHEIHPWTDLDLSNGLRSNRASSFQDINSMHGYWLYIAPNQIYIRLSIIWAVCKANNQCDKPVNLGDLGLWGSYSWCGTRVPFGDEQQHSINTQCALSHNRWTTAFSRWSISRSFVPMIDSKHTIEQYPE
jgi:hypothetical protein